MESSGMGISNSDMEKYLKFRCSVCHKICSGQKTLEMHMHIHTGAKPYVCDYVNCGAKFNHPSNLNRHVKSVHMKTC